MHIIRNIINIIANIVQNALIILINRSIDLFSIIWPPLGYILLLVEKYMVIKMENGDDRMQYFLKYFRPYKKYIIGVLFFMFLNVMSELYLPTLMSQIVDKGIINGDISYILTIGLRMLLIAVIATLSSFISALFSSKSAMGVSRDIREEVFTKAERFSIDEFNQIGTSSLITRSINDIAQLQQVAILSLRMMVRAPMMLIGGVIMAYTKNKNLFLILLGVMPVLIASIILVGRKGFPLFKIVQEKVDGLNLVLREKLTGIRVIRAFNKTNYEEERFAEASKDLSMVTLKVGRTMSMMMPLMSLVLNFTTVLVIWKGSREVSLGNMQVGDLMAFIQYVSLIMFSLIMVSVMFIMIPRAAASANRVREVLEMENSVLDKGDLEVDKIRSLEFENVGFKYTGSSMDALCNLNFKVESGETLAIIGGTGSGKSTLINLIPRFYNVTSGAIKVNGINIEDIRQDNLRAKIGFTPQKSLLFSGTIEENIKYGKEDASEEEITNALRVSQSLEFVSELEGGVNSIVAQGGGNLSGGQKQRLAIARTLVRQPDIYVFDDSFSALDFKTDAKLRADLSQVTGESIVVLVAQRVSTILDADKIMVLDQGKIVGFGNHEKLLENSEVYKEIVRSQFSEEEI